MSSVERFEDLRFWQEARARWLTPFTMQRTTLRVFRDQMRSAALSIMNNISEGFERRTDVDFAHFLDIAKGSAGEVRSMLYLAEDCRFVQSNDCLRLRSEASALSRGIAQLANYLRRDRST
jgi:four helix bundle protein